jgi:HTH-type transcriptional regulator, cell division transcriptional repressor
MSDLDMPSELATARRIGARLRAARETAGLSLRELAQRVGLRDHTVIIKYEQGRTSPSTARLVSLAAALGVSPAALLAARDAAAPLLATIDQANEAQLAQVAFMLDALDAPDPELPDPDTR